MGGTWLAESAEHAFLTRRAVSWSSTSGIEIILKTNKQNLQNKEVYQIKKHYTK